MGACEYGQIVGGTCGSNVDNSGNVKSLILFFWNCIFYFQNQQCDKNIYQQVPVTSGITIINYKTSTITTKDLQTRETLREIKSNKKKNNNNNKLHDHKLNSFLQPFSLHSLMGTVKTNLYIR